MEKEDLTSYDANGAKTYILDDGDYYFAIGNGAHEALNNVLKAKGAAVDGKAELSAVWNNPAFDGETYAVSSVTGLPITNRFDNADLNKYEGADGQTVTYLSRSDWQGTWPQTQSLHITEQMWADGLTHEESGRQAIVEKMKAEIYRLEGGYLSLPRWGKGVRRGAVHGHPVGIYPPERLEEMTPREINACIQRDIREDAWERQAQAPIPYRGKRRAEGLERALYACPGCGRVGTLHSRDDRVFCGCGFSRVYTETGFLDPAAPFPTLAEWEDWQRGLLRSRAFPPLADCLFSDEEIALSQVFPDHRETPLLTGRLQQREDALLCGDRCFPLSEIENMALVQAHLLLLSIHGEYYQLRARGPVNLRKYLEIWKEGR